MNEDTLTRYKKAVVAAVVALIALLSFVVVFDPGTQTAAIAVTVAVFNVVGVAMAKNHTIDDLSKAVVALEASALGLLTLFVTVDPDTVEAVGAIVLAALNVYGVYHATNKPSSKASRLAQ